MEAKHIAKNITLDDCTESLAQTPTFVNLKDRKENFRTIHSCCFISPSKSELCKVSRVTGKREQKLGKVLECESVEKHGQSH